MKGTPKRESREKKAHDGMEHSFENRHSKIATRFPSDLRVHRLRYDAEQAEAWRALLSNEERERLEGYGVEKRQREFLLGRVAARQLLSTVLETTPQAVLLSVADDGAVEVEGAEGFCLSISHTADEAAAAVAQRSVGVDVERIAPRPERLHRFLLSEKERPLLASLPLTTPEAFTLCWGLKEAVLKALRCGLRRSPKIVRLADIDVESGTARLTAEGEQETFAAQFVREGDCWLVVAYGAKTEA